MLDSAQQEAIRSTISNIVPQACDIARAQEELSKKKADLHRAKAELARLLQRESDDHVARILGEPNAPAEKPKRLARIANLRDDITGLEGAIPILEARLRDAIAARDEVARSRPIQIMPVIRESRDTTLDEVKTHLQAMLPTLGRLAAHDRLQFRLLGASANKTLTSDDFLADRLARALLEKLPQRLRPDPEVIEKCLTDAHLLGDQTADQILQGVPV